MIGLRGSFIVDRERRTIGFISRSTNKRQMKRGRDRVREGDMFSTISNSKLGHVT